MARGYQPQWREVLREQIRGTAETAAEASSTAYPGRSQHSRLPASPADGVRSAARGLAWSIFLKIFFGKCCVRVCAAPRAKESAPFVDLGLHFSEADHPKAGTCPDFVQESPSESRIGLCERAISLIGE